MIQNITNIINCLIFLVILVYVRALWMSTDDLIKLLAKLVESKSASVKHDLEENLLSRVNELTHGTRPIRPIRRFKITD